MVLYELIGYDEEQPVVIKGYIFFRIFAKLLKCEPFYDFIDLQYDYKDYVGLT